MTRLYDTLLWDEARERTLVRDGHCCTVARLIGGECSPILDVHHIRPVSEGGDPYDLDNLITCCHSCHPRLEAFRRYLLKDHKPRRCNHRHRYDHARRECWNKMNPDVVSYSGVGD